ncbi:hypothetical protein [Roseiarcus fermentans]|uniref:hypothetical protein n=1 Tax=Roseiarcus fermentans TaxID=1473586 RepID=UPI0011BFAEC5|nr:hypothetical protein [Roseiarcus fermentans]
MAAETDSRHSLVEAPFQPNGAGPVTDGRVKRRRDRRSTPARSRIIFQTSRLADLASQKEFVNQTGDAVSDWRLVIPKEFADNALDGGEVFGRQVRRVEPESAL